MPSIGTKNHILDRDVLAELCALGFGGVYTSEEHGGSGLGRLEAALIFEQLSKGCIGHATFLTIHNMAAWMVDRFGSRDLRERFVGPMVRGEMITSYCLTEPNNGSDAANLTTRADRDGDSYILNGAKVFISGAGFSDLYIVMARSEGPGPKGISAFFGRKRNAGAQLWQERTQDGLERATHSHGQLRQLPHPRCEPLGRCGARVQLCDARAQRWSLEHCRLFPWWRARSDGPRLTLQPRNASSLGRPLVIFRTPRLNSRIWKPRWKPPACSSIPPQKRWMRRAGMLRHRTP